MPSVTCLLGCPFFAEQKKGGTSTADIIARLTVLFEDPFWIGVYERECDQAYQVCKITFGAEPKEHEVYDFMLRSFTNLLFSPAAETEKASETRMSPKRMQRAVKKQLQDTGIGTKAQQTLKLQQEQRKTERKVLSRERREAQKERQFELRAEKRKEKHRGH